MKSWLVWIVPFLLWQCCTSQNVCEEPPDIEFGEMVSDEKAKYLESDRVQYQCNPGYAMEGSEWIICNGRKWTPPPKCLAPCGITKEQLQAKNLLLSGGRRRSQVIQSNQTLNFLCMEGYVLTAPSVRTCIDGHMDLPLCITERGGNCSSPPTIQNGDIINSFQKQYTSGSSVEFKCQRDYVMEGHNRSFCANGNWTKVPICLERGGNCSRPPIIQNGDIITLSRKQYTSGSSVEFKCQRYYAMEGHGSSFCDNGNWTKVPLCLEPCAISLAEMEKEKIEVKGGLDENEPQNMYIQRGNSVEFTCKSGYALATNPSQSAFVIQCDGKPIVYPECKEITCNPPRVAKGTFRPQRNVYQDGDIIRIECDGVIQVEGGQKIAECTRNGWSPSPECITGNGCGPPPRLATAELAEPSDKQTYSHGEVVLYNCRPGYIKRGHIRYRCNNGNWGKALPEVECRKKPCGHPGDIQFGSFDLIHGEEFAFGARVVYQCDEGHQMLSQTNYRDCRADGWSNTVPHCEGIPRI